MSFFEFLFLGGAGTIGLMVLLMVLLPPTEYLSRRAGLWFHSTIFNYHTAWFGRMASARLQNEQHRSKQEFLRWLNVRVNGALDGAQVDELLVQAQKLTPLLRFLLQDEIPGSIRRCNSLHRRMSLISGVTHMRDIAYEPECLGLRRWMSNLLANTEDLLQQYPLTLRLETDDLLNASLVVRKSLLPICRRCPYGRADGSCRRRAVPGGRTNSGGGGPQMTRPKIPAEESFRYHAGQVRVVGAAGQRKLGRSRAAVFGTGRVGSSVVIGLHAAGVGVIDCFDPQRIEPEQLGPFFFAQKLDIGTPKALALAQFLNQRRAGFVNGIVGSVETTPLDRVRRASVIISCANTIAARVAAERLAISAGVPILQVAAFDGREQLGGMITLRHPANRHLACYGCIADKNEPAQNRRDGLMTPVTAVLGHLAAHFATLLLSGYRDRPLLAHNVFMVDLEQCRIERIAVSRRRSCEVCGR